MFAGLRRRGWLVGLAIIAAACAAPTAAPTPIFPVSPTAALELPATPTLAPSPAPNLPSPAPPPTVPASPTPVPPCVNDARFIADASIPDGQPYQPGQTDSKRWLVENNGGCVWGPDYRLVLIGGNPLGAALEQALYPARAGQTGVWEIALSLPNEPGVYTGRWRARDPQGKLFGDVVFVKVEVLAPPTPIP